MDDFTPYIVLITGTTPYIWELAAIKLKMKELLEKYANDSFGNLEIPETDEKKQQLAREVFGKNLVSVLDGWLEIAFDFVDNPEPKEPFQRENEFSRRDKAFRENFKNLDSQTKEKIKELISDTATGILFSTLVSFDQFDYGQLKITLSPKTIDNLDEEWIITDEDIDLHDELDGWVENYSKQVKNKAT
ncbi:hypothetical protein AHMF7605_03060 [Adhaeribacter arboris]|uniref:Uncharacterized protein n=1 Tax=Adhaeribacter arboris TaxID=2072846 RepID=A0A2T2YAR6_9BACT|nr:hypothetical protein [Adhaeribacter arboris]PSR52576.1 hypothetical protein AHMF7605_03060 [Adhaeribacter arboris]